MTSNQLKIIFVHGACHGAWTWYKVAAGLRSDGHSVLVLDLAASGINEKRLVEDVFTFAEYSQPLMEAMAELPEGEKVVLVGHSLGGLNLALAMEAFPEKIAVAVFVTAFLPETSSPLSCVFDKLGEFITDAAWMDTVFKEVRVPGTEEPFLTMLFGPQFMGKRLYQLCAPELRQRLAHRKIELEVKPVMVPGKAEPLITICFDSNVLAAYLYQNCSFEDLTLANMMMRPTTIFDDLRKNQPFKKEGFGSVDKIYIICDEDATINEEYQRWMIHNNDTVKETIEIKGADHMPMFSKSQELCQCLISIIDKYFV